MPLFSVLLPVYNNKEDVTNAINSVLNQTMDDWELIIINDHSTDGTTEIIQTFQSNPKITIIQNPKNMGLFVSLNEGLSIAKGKYIARVDSDDTLEKNFLEEHSKAFTNNPDCLIVHSQYRRDGGHGITGEITMIYNKEIINKVGYYDSVRFAADTEFHLRVRKYFSKDIVKMDKVLYNAKKRDNSLTTSNETGLYGKGSSIRSHYVGQFNRWHRNTDLYMPYPLETRPFEVNAIMLP
jgi:glycosyltransferase involved in cell wall biosynthesis